MTPPLVDEHVAAYPVIAVPPSLTGVENVTINEPVLAVVEPDTALADLGAPGAVAAVTGLEASEAEPVPAPLVAATLHV